MKHERRSVQVATTCIRNRGAGARIAHQALKFSRPRLDGKLPMITVQPPDSASTQIMFTPKPLLIAALCLATCLTSSHSVPAAQVAGKQAEDKAAGAVDAAPKKAVMIEFHEMITPLSGALLKRRFEEAKRAGANIIVLDIDSPGGYVSTTLELVSMLEAERDIETIAYIQREAISGAAILSLAADKIVMAPTSLIGDAGMITMGDDAAFRYAPEKERSYLAQRLRTIAENSGRPPALAEAMVDKDLSVFQATHATNGNIAYFSDREWKGRADQAEWVKGLPVHESGNNTFFTVKGARAVELGMADVIVEQPEDLAAAIGVRGAIPIVKGNWTDTLILILNQPLITALLLTIGLVALVIEVSTAGLGISGLISIFCFGLFFWSRFLGGTSGWFEVVLFLIGLIFLALELFVIPGFGIAGISGIGLVIFSLVMASRRVMMPESVRDAQALTTEVFTVLASLIAFFFVMVFLSHFLGRLPLLSRLALAPEPVDGNAMVASLAGGGAGMLDAEELVIGQQGVTQGPLRPGGRVQFGEQFVDVVSDGEFVDSGTTVKIIAKHGHRIVVRAV